MTIENRLTMMGKFGPKTPNLVNKRCKVQKVNQSLLFCPSIKLTYLLFNWYLIDYDENRGQKGKAMKDLFPGTCVAPSGEFVYGIHKPRFRAANLRENDYIVDLGRTANEETINNADTFPEKDVQVSAGAWLFEIPNAFPFMGATFILKSKADQTIDGCNPFGDLLGKPGEGGRKSSIKKQSRGALLSLASSSTDPELLASLAELSCQFTYDKSSNVVSGRLYRTDESGNLSPTIKDFHLFQLVSNNPSLPDAYKRQMVLIPGVQGKSPIVGEYKEGDSHVWEYLRENSYIPWGHYAANMAHDAVRYSISSLTPSDLSGLRHLYYQRIYVQLAAELGLPVPTRRIRLAIDDLESLRLSILNKIEECSKSGASLPFNGVIWGQNYGFALSASGYRLGGSHQQIHQQFALVRSNVPVYVGGENERSYFSMETYGQGDQIAQFSKAYREKTGKGFFETYLQAIQRNRRLDGRTDKASDLIIYQDENIAVFVPKAQRSQGEIQIISKGQCGNIVEADPKIRHSLDSAILLTMRILENLGVEIFNSFEISKRLDNLDQEQRLLYCFFPRHPQSPGGFSEFQQRWINNHYPEDFAKACRDELDKIMEQG